MKISDETIEYISILAKLELSEEERKLAGKDMSAMLDYVEILNTLDTNGVEPMSHALPVFNVFREDVVGNENAENRILANAPEKKKGMFKVPKAVD